MSTLDVLEGTRDSLADPSKPFEFKDWGLCTCGHVYSAATGRKLRATTRGRVLFSTPESRLRAIRVPHGVYADALNAIVKANGGVDSPRGDVQVVSDLTVHRTLGLGSSTTHDTQLRATALRLVENAVAFERERLASAEAVAEAEAVTAAAAERELVEA